MKTGELEMKLSAPFRADEISFRVGATNKDKTTGMCLYYMDARAVENRLDEVCGIAGWQNRYPFDGCCEIGIKVMPALMNNDGEITHNGEWIWKTNGAGETDFEGEKGKYSDAFKRAATMWGIGRYLYGGPSKWYEIQSRGRSYTFTDTAMAQIKKDYNTWIHGIHRFAPGEKAELIKQMRDAAFNGDKDHLDELFREQPKEAILKVWPEFSSTERRTISDLRGE